VASRQPQAYFSIFRIHLQDSFSLSQDLLQRFGRSVDITDNVALKLQHFLAGSLLSLMQQLMEKGESCWFKAIQLEPHFSQALSRSF
jgi:hypothetical protein